VPFQARNRFLWHWLPPLVWMALIFAVSAQPDLPHAEEPWLDVLLKKAGHALAYGVLAWLYRRALRRRFSADVILRIVSIGLTVAYCSMMISPNSRSCHTRTRSCFISSSSASRVTMTSMRVVASERISRKRT